MIDGSYIPTTLSYKILTELLKGELGYRGVVITDAIGMAALHTLMSENELYINLILAGNDMILGPTQTATDDYIDVIEKAVLEGRIPESRIDDACSRVLEMKKNIGMFRDDYGLDIELTPELTGQTVKIEEMAAKKAVTLIKNQGMLPLSSDKVKKVLIAPMAYSEDFDESIRYTGELLSARGIEVDYILPGDAWLKYDMTNIKEYDLVLAATYMAPHRPFGGNTLQGKHIETLHLLQLCANSKTLGIAYGSPHLYFDWFTNTGKAFVAAYNYTNPLQEAVVSALFGEIQFEGKCPFELIPDYIRNNPFA
jgi:beta-glucosidase-like glycosyl hydrolase